jgi:anti-sigma factor RsiW
MNISVNVLAPFASWSHTARPCTMAGALERAQAPELPSPFHQPPPPPRRDRLEEDRRHVARLARSSPSNSDPAISDTIMNSHIFASLLHHGTTSMHALHSCSWDEVTHGDTVTHRQVM